MNWSDERYVRLYTRDTADWMALSFDAQALLSLLLRKADRSGAIACGKHGKRAAAIVIGHAREWSRLEPALEELLEDGVIEFDGESLFFPNFVEAQEAKASDRKRQRDSRERRGVTNGHSRSRPVTNDDKGSRSVTQRDDGSQNVTECHDGSHGVTPSLAVPSLAVPSEELSGADAPGGDPEATDRTKPGDLFPTTEAPKKPRKPPTTGIGGDCTRWLERFRELSAKPSEAPDEVLARSADTKEVRVRYANARKVPGRTAEVLLTALERGLEGAWWGAKTPLAMLSEQAITAGLAPPRNDPGGRPAAKEPSGRLPVYTPRPRPQEPVTEEDRQKAAEARQQLANLTGGLAAKVKPPDAQPLSREAIEARRAMLQEQARSLA